MMSCCRNRCRRRDRDEVAGIQEIALRGPGCIDGTGRCRDVLGNTHFIHSSVPFPQYITTEDEKKSPNGMATR